MSLSAVEYLTAVTARFATRFDKYAAAQFSQTTLQEVLQVVSDIDETNKSRSASGMIRIRIAPFLDSMEHFTKAIEGFVNDAKYSDFIWVQTG